MENVSNPEQYIPAVLSKCKRSYVEKTYEVKGWNNPTEFLELLARKGGRLLKGGEPDLDGVAKMVLNDFMRGKLPWFTPCLKPEATEEEKLEGRKGRLGEMSSKKRKAEVLEKECEERLEDGQEHKDGEQADYEEWGGFGDEESTVVESEGCGQIEGDDEGEWEDESGGEGNGEVDVEAGASDASDIDDIEIDEQEMGRLVLEAQEESRVITLGQLSTSSVSSFGHLSKRAKRS